MTSKERVLTALNYKEADRCPCDYIGTPEVDEKLLRHFETDDMEVVLRKLGADLRVLDLPYIGPELRVWDDGRFENYWGSIRKAVRNEAGEYNEAVEFPYAKFESVADVEKFRWPKIEWFDFSTISRQCEKYCDYAVVYGSPGNMDLINGTAYGRGVERVLYDIALEDPVGLACMEKRFECCYAISERALEQGGGRIDILWIGDDYGTQNGLLMGPDRWRKLFFAKLSKMCELGHRYGAKVMLHCCGGTRGLWPDLIDAGVDIYQTIQPEAKDMEPASLKEEFGERICFHGTISIQKTLPFGSAKDVTAEVRRRIETVGAGGGLILAPSHNMQPDTPVENILAMYDAVRGKLIAF
ncbi:MAG: uroporphyrinogen decarboxylase family protein [Planctomycetota bacterium]|jgi:uroporphyrinogen decarboxylase